MSLKKVLIFYNYAHHYRLDVFNELASKFDLTVVLSGEQDFDTKVNFKTFKTRVLKLGPFFIRNTFKYKLKDYDYVVVLSDLRWISDVFVFLLNFGRCNFILWGNWMTKNNFANKLRVGLSKIAYSNLFYSPRAMKEFIRSGVSPTKCFVANNTIGVMENINCSNQDNKKSILFVGSLNGRKRVDVLINSFKSILPSIAEDIVLNIVGNGKEYSHLTELVKSHQITDRVIFHGTINDNNTLVDFFKDAICNISYGQAGLSVLQSMGYGVPFCTSTEAISGGEIENIINSNNGILVENELTLNTELIRVINDPSYARFLGNNAYEYYWKFCSPENMVNGFEDSFFHTNKSKIYNGRRN